MKHITLSDLAELVRISVFSNPAALSKMQDGGYTSKSATATEQPDVEPFILRTAHRDRPFPYDDEIPTFQPFQRLDDETEQEARLAMDMKLIEIRRNIERKKTT